MRLTPRHRQHTARVPRISISQEEITADLIYPARRQAPAPESVPARRKRR
jgi:hypothetical protein